MDRWLAAADVAVGLSLVVLAVVMIAPPAMRVLLAFVGVLWLLGTVEPALGATHRTAVALCILAFPSGHLEGRVRWALALASIALSTGTVPQVGTAAYFLVVAAVLFALRDRELVTGSALAAFLVGASVGISWAVQTFDPASFDPRHHLLSYQGAILATGVLLTGATVLRPLRSRSLADHLLAGDSRGGVAGLAALLRVTLRDPDLVILQPGTETFQARLRASVEVRDGDDVVAVLHHRRGSIPDERTLRSVVEAIRLAVAQELRTHVLEVQSRELVAAGNRLAQAADQRRAELSGQLNDEVLSRIAEARVTVEAAIGRSTVRESGSALAIVRKELRATKQDLRHIVDDRWRRPGHGRLPAALGSLASLSESINVRADPSAVADPETETALYYVAAEAVTNALKHARARSIVVRLIRAGAELVLSVADDGQGGADPTGAGLAGLRSRLDTCNGTLEMSSPGGAGTTITARAPVRRSSTTPR